MDNEQHLLIGERQGRGDKIHVIYGETGEIRIDKKDQKPSELLKKVSTVLSKPDGSTVSSTIEFLNKENEYL